MAAPEDWHKSVSIAARQQMQKNVIQLLKALKPRATAEWLSKLPQMAVGLEETLFRQARTRAEYDDPTTLSVRLKKVAEAQAARRRARPPNPPVSQQVAGAIPGVASRVMVDMSAMNPMMAGVTNGAAAGSVAAPPIVAPPASGAVPAQPSPAANSLASPVSAAPATAQTNGASVPAVAVSAVAQSGDLSDEQKKALLRQQQQRLLLLRHASKCTNPPGTCKATPHCTSMKKLWEHLAKCKNPRCDVRHCVSSRYVLSHYHRCTKKCDVCTPVRNAIQRHNEKLKALKAAKDRAGGGGGGGAPALSLESAAQAVRGGNLPQPALKKARPANRSRAPIAPSSFRSSSAASTAVVAARVRSDLQSQTLAECFTLDQLETHYRSLRRKFNALFTREEIKQHCVPVLKALMDRKNAWPFCKPVDYERLGLTDYTRIVKRPMDLGTIKKKLDGGTITAFEDFASHVRLVFRNAILYNPSHDFHHREALALLDFFERDYAEMEVKSDKEVSKRLQEDPDACRLCAGNKLHFEQAVLHCNGPCGSKIRRNAYYYTDRQQAFHWCTNCFNENKSDIFTVGETQILRGDLKRKKHDKVEEESWVQCDTCKGWLHQICALFNAKCNEGMPEGQLLPLSCPMCLLVARKARPTERPAKRWPGASELRKSDLTRDLERRATDMIHLWRKKRATTLRVPLEKIPEVPKVIIRIVSCRDATFYTKRRMYERYRGQGFTDVHYYRQKAIVMFQRIEGVDILIFAMYVQEYGDDCPGPNRRTAYLSYLDSVKYFRPEELRTDLYHELLIAYLGHLRRRGFERLVLWACPPLKGDDYIIYCHPPEQRTPKPERLREWYVTMINKAVRAKVVDSWSYLADEYFPPGRVQQSLTNVPYYEGDYWPDFAEDYIKELEEGTGEAAAKKGKGKGKDKKSRKPAKRKAGAGGRKGKKARRGSDDESGGEDFITSDEEEPEPDEVADRISKLLHDMQKDFLVVHLRPPCGKCRRIVSGSRDDPYFECSECADHENPVRIILCPACHKHESRKAAQKRHPRTRSEAHTFREITSNPSVGNCADTDMPIENNQQEYGEFFDTRKRFLNLCVGNKYQFDQLRRAKHSSMMVLYHLHNPAAPSFVHTCNNCGEFITTGRRWACQTCQTTDEFDLCDKCHGIQSVVNSHPHQLMPYSTTGSADRNMVDEDAAARDERNKSVMMHMRLLVHASECAEAKCESKNCHKMKALLRHGARCTVRATGGCHVCKRIWALLQIHARQCRMRREQCPVPRCPDLKEHLRNAQYASSSRTDHRRIAAEKRRREAAAQARQAAAGAGGGGGTLKLRIPSKATAGAGAGGAAAQAQSQAAESAKSAARKRGAQMLKQLPAEARSRLTAVWTKYQETRDPKIKEQYHQLVETYKDLLKKQQGGSSGRGRSNGSSAGASAGTAQPRKEHSEATKAKVFNAAVQHLLAVQRTSAAHAGKTPAELEASAKQVVSGLSLDQQVALVKQVRARQLAAQRAHEQRGAPAATAAGSMAQRAAALEAVSTTASRDQQLQRIRSSLKKAAEAKGKHFTDEQLDSIALNTYKDLARQKAAGGAAAAIAAPPVAAAAAPPIAAGAAAPVLSPGALPGGAEALAQMLVNGTGVSGAFGAVAAAAAASTSPAGYAPPSVAAPAVAAPPVGALPVAAPPVAAPAVAAPAVAAPAVAAPALAAPAVAAPAVAAPAVAAPAVAAPAVSAAAPALSSADALRMMQGLGAGGGSATPVAEAVEKLMGGGAGNGNGTGNGTNGS